MKYKNTHAEEFEGRPTRDRARPVFAMSLFFDISMKRPLDEAPKICTFSEDMFADESSKQNIRETITLSGPHSKTTPEYEKVREILSGTVENWQPFLCRTELSKFSINLAKKMQSSDKLKVFLSRSPLGEPQNCEFISAILVCEIKSDEVYVNLLCAGLNGVGSRMLSYALQNMKENGRGIQHITLHTLKKAKGFYEKYGFVFDNQSQKMTLIQRCREYEFEYSENIDTRTVDEARATAFSVQSMAFSALSSDYFLAISDSDNTVRLLNIYGVPNGNPVPNRILGTSTDEGRFVVFSPKDEVIASASASTNEVLLWVFKSLETLEDPISMKLHGHTDGVRSVTFSSEYSLRNTNEPSFVDLIEEGSKDESESESEGVGPWHVATGDGQGDVRLWFIDPINKTEQIKLNFIPHEAGVRSMAFSCKNFQHRHTLCASVHNDNTVSLWNVDTGVSVFKAQGFKTEGEKQFSFDCIFVRPVVFCDGGRKRRLMCVGRCSRKSQARAAYDASRRSELSDVFTRRKVRRVSGRKPSNVVSNRPSGGDYARCTDTRGGDVVSIRFRQHVSRGRDRPRNKKIQ